MAVRGDKKSQLELEKKDLWRAKIAYLEGYVRM